MNSLVENEEMLLLILRLEIIVRIIIICQGDYIAYIQI